MPHFNIHLLGLYCDIWQSVIVKVTNYFKIIQGNLSCALDIEWPQFHYYICSQLTSLPKSAYSRVHKKCLHSLCKTTTNMFVLRPSYNKPNQIIKAHCGPCWDSYHMLLVSDQREQRQTQNYTSHTWSFITSPQAGAPTSPVPTFLAFLSSDPTLRGFS